MLLPLSKDIPKNNLPQFILHSLVPQVSIEQLQYLDIV